MNIILYLLLGIVQGITEPLPISSKGHVLLFNNIFHVVPDTGGQILFFLAIVHFASLISITLIFWHKIVILIKCAFLYFTGKEQTKKTKKETQYLIYLLIAFCVFTPIAFVLGETIAPKLFGNSELFLAIGYLITTLLLLASTVLKFKHTKSNSELTLKDAIFIGLSQVFAIFPGVSRSGTTLVAGLSRHLKKETAIEFSFFLFIPTVLGANVYYLFKAFKQGIGLTPDLLVPYIFAFLGSLLATYFSFKLFIFTVKSNKLYLFAIYTFILALLLILNPGGFFNGDMFSS